MRILAVIPARLGSTRLPRKPLRTIAGLPLVVRVAKAACASPLLSPENVVVATDAAEIIDICRQFGCRAQLTSPELRSGTERVWEVAQAVTAEVYLNIQGDEPLIRGEHISLLVRLMQSPSVAVGTLKTPARLEDLRNPNAVKVVTDRQSRALYFSRSTIPFDRDGTGNIRVYKHLGLYAYRREALAHFVSLPESELEQSERLEQLRFLENGIDIHVAETPFDTIGVDTEEDLQRVEEMLAGKQ